VLGGHWALLGAPGTAPGTAPGAGGRAWGTSGHGGPWWTHPAPNRVAGTSRPGICRRSRAAPG